MSRAFSPPRSIRPAAIGSPPHSAAASVVFPAPFGPATAVSDAGREAAVQIPHDARGRRGAGSHLVQPDRRRTAGHASAQNTASQHDPENRAGQQQPRPAAGDGDSGWRRAGRSWLRYNIPNAGRKEATGPLSPAFGLSTVPYYPSPDDPTRP